MNEDDEMDEVEDDENEDENDDTELQNAQLQLKPSFPPITPQEANGGRWVVDWSIISRVIV